MFAAFNELQRLEITLHGRPRRCASCRTRQHRVTDILSLVEDPVPYPRGRHRRGVRAARGVIEAAFARIDLDTVLFAVATTPVEPVPELRTPKVPEEAIISIPPFRVTGTMHLLPSEGNLRAALSGSRVVSCRSPRHASRPTTSASRARRRCWSRWNHRRAQILAPHQVRDLRSDVDAPAAWPRPGDRGPVPISVRPRPRRRSIRGGSAAAATARRADRPVGGVVAVGLRSRSAASAAAVVGHLLEPVAHPLEVVVVSDGSLPSVASSQFSTTCSVASMPACSSSGRGVVGHPSLLVVRGAIMAAPCSQARARTGSPACACVATRFRPVVVRSPSLPMDRRAFQAERSDEQVGTAGPSNWR